MSYDGHNRGVTQQTCRTGSEMRMRDRDLLLWGTLVRDKFPNEPFGKKEYYIYSKENKHYVLDVDRNDSKNGRRIKANIVHWGKNQQWVAFECDTHNHFGLIRSIKSDKCIDMKGGKKIHSEYHQIDCDCNNQNQLFSFV